MLETRIDLERVAELTGGGKMVSFTDGGLGADAWYLRLKNYVVGADANPQAVFIFFRDDVLTDPRANPTGEQFDSLRALMGEAEPGYDAIVTANSDLTNEVGKFFRWLYPVQERRSTAAEALQRVSGSTLMPDLLLSTVRRGFSIYGLGSFDRTAYRAGLADYERLKQDVNGVFDREHFRRAADSNDASTSAPVFEEVVDESFLPLILDLGIDQDIRLVFVRVQRRPEADGSIPGSRSLDRYIQNLNGYLNASNAGFIDMNGNPDIRLEHYLDTDHITPSYMSAYTDIFFQKARSEFDR